MPAAAFGIANADPARLYHIVQAERILRLAELLGAHVSPAIRNVPEAYRVEEAATRRLLGTTRSDARVRSLRGRRARLRDKLWSLPPAYVAALYPRAAGLADVTQRLPGHTALIEYAGGHAFVITRGKASIVSIGDDLVRPALAALPKGITTLVVSPNVALAFGAQPIDDKGTPVAQVYDVAWVHSASAVPDTDEPLRRGRGLRVFAPDPSVSFARLRQLMGAAGSTIAMVSDPAELTGARTALLHMECTAETDPIAPALSRLGPLTVQEIRDLGLRAGVVSIPRCEPDGAGPRSFDALASLAAAVLASGARAALISLEEIDNPRATDFLVSFYGLWLAGGRTPAQALGEARRRAIRAGVPARIWGNYVLWQSDFGGTR